MSDTANKKSLAALSELMSIMSNSGADLGASQEYNNLLELQDRLGGGYNPIVDENTGAVMYRNEEGNPELWAHPIYKSDSDYFIRDTPYAIDNLGRSVNDSYKGNTIDPYYITEEMGLIDESSLTKAYLDAKEKFLDNSKNWYMVKAKYRPKSNDELKSIMFDLADKYAKEHTSNAVGYRRKGGLIPRRKH